jgi:hypothetical protein
MMPMKSNVTLTTLLAAIAAGALSAQAMPGDARQDGRMDAQMPPPPRMEGMRGPGAHQGPPPPPSPERLKELGATEAQIEAVRTAVFEHESRSIGFRAAAELAELKLRYAMDAAAPKEEDAMTAVAAVSEARGNLLKEDVALRLKLQAILGQDIAQKLHAPPPDRAPGRDGDRQPPAPPAVTRGDANPPPDANAPRERPQDNQR